MELETLKAFFGWCSIINMGLLLFALFVMSLIGDLAYKIHTKLFPMPRDTFNVVIYSLFGLMKILVFIFNIIPYFALVIMTRPAA